MIPSETVFTVEEREAIGDVEGLTVLVHVGGGVGAEAVAFAEAGATVVALVPFNLGDADEAKSIRDVVLQYGHDMEVIDLHQESYPDEYRDGSFDLVYVGPMSVCWVADHDGWSHDLFEALMPGGRLVIYDEHPDSYALVPLSDEDEEEVEKIEEALEEGLAEDVTGDLPDRFDWNVDDFLDCLEQAGLDSIVATDLVGPARFLTTVDIVADESSEIAGALLVVAARPE